MNKYESGQKAMGVGKKGLPGRGNYVWKNGVLV